MITAFISFIHTIINFMIAQMDVFENVINFFSKS